MKIKINNSASWKQFVASFNNIVTASSNPNERCLYFETVQEHDRETGQDVSKVQVTALKSYSHKAALTFVVDVLEEGSFYIQNDVFQSMTKALPSDANTLELEYNRVKKVTYRSNGLGSLSESSYHNQDAFSHFVFKEIGFRSLGSVDKAFASTINAISSTCGNYPEALARFDSGEVSIYAQFTESGLVKFQMPQDIEVEAPIEVYLKHLVAKSLVSLGEADLSFRKSPTSLKVQSPSGSFNILGVNTKIGEYEALDWVISHESLGSFEVPKADLTRALSWQSYGSGPEDSISFKLENNYLKLKGSKVNEAASIQVSGGDFPEIKVPVNGITQAASFFNSIIEFSQVELSMGTRTIKVLVLKSGLDEDISITAVLYEQVQLNR